MDALTEGIERIAADTMFSGVVRVDIDGEPTLTATWGKADRAHDISTTVDTQFGIASGTKGFTALTVMRLVEEGQLGLTTTARSLLGPDLPLIDDRVTVEHLLGHRSGIGDYLDEDTDVDIFDHLMPVPVHQLDTTESYLRVIDGHAAKFQPDQDFSYCNSGFVLLALLAERAAAVPFHELVRQFVFDPAGMADTAFLRSDELPGTAAVGYLHPEGLRTNVLHLPVRGSGDGGCFTTAADVHSMWRALFSGRIVGDERVAQMVTPRSDVPSQSSRYGLGFWLHASTDAVILEGCDAGVSFRSVHQPQRQTTHTVLSNTTRGAWPIARRLDELLIV